MYTSYTQYIASRLKGKLPKIYMRVPHKDFNGVPLKGEVQWKSLYRCYIGIPSSTVTN